MSAKRFLHNSPSESLNQPESAFKYEWNVPVPMLIKRGGVVEYVLQWILADENKNGVDSQYSLDGAWIDPEAQTFMRVSYGFDYSQFRKV